MRGMEHPYGCCWFESIQSATNMFNLKTPKKMKNVILHNLVRFYPYESVHASDFTIQVEDIDKSWYSAIVKLLSFYEPKEYINCSPGYFALRMDNKITLELDLKYYHLFITYWDNNVYLSDHYTPISSKNPKYCTVQLKPKKS
jgi:hypothetical protein